MVAVEKVIDAFIALGPGAILCLPLMGWIYLIQTRNNVLVDKIIELSTASTAATANNTAATNRLADMLSVRRTPE